MEKVRLGSKSSLYPYPVTIISTEVEGKPNFMNLGFVGIVNANPGMVAMGVGKHHYTTDALKEGTVFALAIANEEMLLKADWVGIRSGFKVDKSKTFKLQKGDNGSNLISEAPINIEVKVLKVLDLGGLDYTIIGEILEVYADEAIMSGKNPDIEKMNPLIFSMYENKYFTVGKNIGIGWKDGLEYEKLKSFVEEVIFPAFDKLESNEFFEPYINDDSIFVFDGVTYKGYNEFCGWLESMRDVLNVDGLNHSVSEFDAKILQNDMYEVSFVAQAKGTFKDGTSFEQTVKEKWVLRKTDSSYVFVSYDTK